ncbi:MAG TPA: lysophospholipid acyltransferase family protein [Pseudomonadota bacterium]|nr:lysophospholipid acyltransferase family protein [Pseudomonadota bacterium]
MSVVAVVTWPLSPRGDLFLTFAKIWSRVIFFVGGIRWVTQRSDKLDLQKSYLYLSNHESLTDILALYATLPQKAVMVAKRSLFILPVFSWGMWLAGFIFINRKNTKEAYARLQSAGKLIRKGRSVLVFPEGTRGDGGELLRLKRGGFVLAQTAQIEVVPVGIAGTAEVLPRDTFPVYPGSIAVCIGEPMAPPRPDEDLPRYMDRVRAEIDKLRAVAREQAAKNR